VRAHRVHGEHRRHRRDQRDIFLRQSEHDAEREAAGRHHRGRDRRAGPPGERQRREHRGDGLGLRRAGQRVEPDIECREGREDQGERGIGGSRAELIGLAGATLVLFIAGAAIGEDNDVLWVVDDLVFFGFIGCVVALVALSIAALVRSMTRSRT
jgi:hypothetical protein